MQESKLIIRGVYISYLHLLVGFVSILLLTPIMLRYLGQSAYGLWALFGSIIGYLALFDFGINVGIAKYTAEYKATKSLENLSKLVSTAFVFLLLIDVLIILFCVGLTPFISGLFKISEDLVSVSQIAFILMGFSVSLMLLGGLFGNTIYGNQRVDIWKTFSIIQLIANFSFTIVFLYEGFGLVGIVMASIISNSILLCSYLFLLHLSSYNIIVHPKLVEIKILREIAPYSIRTFVLNLSSRLLYYSDYIVIGIFLGIAQVTPYEIAYKICFLITYLFSVISTAVFPRFSKLYALGDIDALRDLYLKTTRISVMIMVPLAIILALCGSSFIDLWVGEENFVGMSVFLVFIFMDISHAVGTPAGLLLQGIGKNKWFMYSEISNAVLNLVLSVVLIGKLGLLGVALGTLTAHLCTSSWIVPLLACHYIKLPVRKYLLSGILQPLLIGMPVGVIAWMFMRNLFPNSFLYLGLKGVLVIAIYLVLYLVLGSIKELQNTSGRQKKLKLPLNASN